MNNNYVSLSVLLSPLFLYWLFVTILVLDLFNNFYMMLLLIITTTSYFVGIRLQINLFISCNFLRNTLFLEFKEFNYSLAPINLRFQYIYYYTLDWPCNVKSPIPPWTVLNAQIAQNSRDPPAYRRQK